MTTKLLESGGNYKLPVGAGRFELPQAANDNLNSAVQSQLTAFREKLLGTTTLTPIQSQLGESNKMAMNIIDLGELSREE